MMSPTSSGSAPNSQPLNYSCPANDGSVVVDQNGVTYQIACSADASGNYITTIQATNSFNDCFAACDTTPSCNAFTYSGGSNGAGAGFCYIKSNGTGYISASSSYVAVLRYTGPLTASLAPTRQASSSSLTGNALASSMTGSTGPQSVPTGTTLTSPVTPNSIFTSSTVMGNMISSQLTPSVVSGTSSILSSLSGQSSTGSGATSASSLVVTISIPSTASTSPVSVQPITDSMASPVVTSSSASPTDETSSDQTTSSTSTLPACPSQTCGATTSSNQTCADAYGNSFSVACGTAYTGRVTKRASTTDINSCLTLCDLTAGCVAMNFIASTGQCDLFDRVDGTVTIPGAAAASRPAEVSTIYTAPPSTTSMANYASATSVMSTSGPVTTTDNGGNSPNMYSTVDSGMSTSSMNGLSTVLSSLGSSMPATGTNTYGGDSATLQSSGTRGSSVSIQSSISPSGVSYGQPSTSLTTGQSTISMPAMSITGRTASSSSSGSFSTLISSATTGSPPASYTGPLCPSYNGQAYTDAQGNTYTVECDQAFSGTAIPYIYKRYSTPTQQSCMAICDSISNCVAITVSPGSCMLYSSVTGTSSSPGSSSLYRIYRPNSNVSIVTISTCAATAKLTTTRYTTVCSTTTVSCSDSAQCISNM